MSPSEILCRAIGLPALPEPPETIPETLCALGNCGRRITAGYPRRLLTTEATNEFLDCFHGNLHGHVCEYCARVFKGNNPHGGNLMARAHWAWDDGTYRAPLISRESAEKSGRPCWSQELRKAWEERRGQRCVIILTTDTKKRLWPLARVGTLGEQTPLLCYDSGSAAASTIVVNWPRLIACLEVIERVYALGWTKESIRSCLYAQLPVAQAAGLPQSRDHERRLSELRLLPEFTPALLVSQRPADYVPPAKPGRALRAAPRPVALSTAPSAPQPSLFDTV